MTIFGKKGSLVCMNPSIAEVCILGVGIVFLGLVCIVLLCYVIGVFCRLGDKTPDSGKSAVATPSTAGEIPNRQEFVAAVSAAIAEYMGKDISAIRILSIKRM